jgi:hypothetical protein
MRDYQRRKVYKWEGSQPWWTMKSYLTEQQVLDAVKKLDKNLPWVSFSKNGWSKINKQKRKTKVIFSNGRGPSNANNKRIKLKREWALNYNVILHEYAHLFTRDKHGPKFVSVYCCLLVAYHPDKPTFKELAKTLNERNIDFDLFDRTWRILELSKRIKPFPDCKRDPLPKPIKKTRQSPKQKLIKLCEEYDWLAYDNETGYEYFKCEVWDIREDENRDLYFDEMIEHADSWKMAYQYALELIERDKKYGRTFDVY